VTFRVALGKLPDGLDLNAKTGEISGTARTVQSFAATIEAANQGGACSWVWAGEVRKETPPADLTYSELPPLFVGVEVEPTLPILMQGIQDATFRVRDRWQDQLAVLGDLIDSICNATQVEKATKEDMETLKEVKRRQGVAE